MNAGTCIHYNGVIGTTDDHKCQAGICYRKVFDGSKPGILLRMPCIQFHTLPAHGRGTFIRSGDDTVRKEFDRRGQVMIPCALYQEPTPEQIEADRIETEKAFANTVAAIKVSSEWRVKPKPEKDRSEILQCPICEGKLHLFQSSYNGHVRGKCETAGCVEWME
jgi:hypothetical protein